MKPCPPTLGDKIEHLTLLFMIPRSKLPLSALDTSIPFDGLPTSSLFWARINDLETAVDNQELHNCEPIVAIARLETKNSLYAIERARKNIYSLCKLDERTDEKLLKTVAVSGSPRRPKTSRNVACEEVLHGEGGFMTEWWKKAAIESIRLEGPAGANYMKVSLDGVRLSMDRPLVSSPHKSVMGNYGVEAFIEQNQSRVYFEPTVVSILDQDQALSNRGTVEENRPPTSSFPEIFDLVQTQYLEALYTSKASLAYFAKGPLSRARG